MHLINQLVWGVDLVVEQMILRLCSSPKYFNILVPFCCIPLCIAVLSLCPTVYPLYPCAPL